MDMIISIVMEIKSNQNPRIFIERFDDPTGNDENK